MRPAQSVFGKRDPPGGAGLRRWRALALVALIGSLTTIAVGMGGAPIAAHASGPSLRSVSSSAANSSIFTVAAPAGEAPGDVLLAALQLNGTGAITAPSGWALVGSTFYGGDATYSYLHVAACGEPTGYTWKSTQYSNGSISILDYTGIDTTTPVNAWAGSSGYGPAGVAPALTTTAPAITVVIATWDGAPSTLSVTDPSGYNRRWSEHSYEWTYGADNATSNPAGALPSVSMPTTPGDLYTAQQIALTVAATTPTQPSCPAGATVTLSTTRTGPTCDLQFATQDVFNGILSSIAAPPGEPSPIQRLAQLNPPYWRINSNTDGGTVALSLPFPASYTSADGRQVPAWDFSHQVALLAEAPQSVEHVLTVAYPPDVMFTGSGNLGPSAGPPASGLLGLGTLADQSYRDLAGYMANLVRYYNTGILATGSGASATYSPTSLTDTSQDFSPYGGSQFSVTVDSLAADGQVHWQTAVIQSVSGPHTLVVSGWPKGTPASGSGYNLASSTPPIVSPVSATPWPRPPHVGPIHYWEIMNEPDMSNSAYPRTSPAVLPPTPTLTGISVAGGTLVPGTTYAYRLTAMSIAGTESLPGSELPITLAAGQNAVRVDWSATSNLGLSPFAYGIYGRGAGAEQAMVVVGRDAPTGLTWTDAGTLNPAGGFTGPGLPTSDATLGMQLFRAHEYRKMWDVVVPAMKAVDPNIKVVGPTISNPSSLAGRDVVTTAVTAGPTDRSWLSSVDFLPLLTSDSANPPDVISVHGYGGSGGSANSDAHMLTGSNEAEGIDNMIARYQAFVQPYVGSTPVWQTEADSNAGRYSSTDFRGLTQFNSAWLASLFANVCTSVPQVRTLFQFEFSLDSNWSIIAAGGPPSSCPNQPACTNIAAGRPLLAYWTLYSLNRLVPRGSKLIGISNTPSGFDVLAVAQPAPSTKIEVLIVNKQVGATTGLGASSTLNLVLPAGTTKVGQEWVIDQNTDLVNGPSPTQLGTISNVTLNLNGYAVAIVELS